MFQWSLPLRREGAIIVNTTIQSTEEFRLPFKGLYTVHNDSISIEKPKLATAYREATNILRTNYRNRMPHWKKIDSEEVFQMIFMLLSEALTSEQKCITERLRHHLCRRARKQAQRQNPLQSWTITDEAIPIYVLFSEHSMPPLSEKEKEIYGRKGPITVVIISRRARISDLHRTLQDQTSIDMSQFVLTSKGHTLKYHQRLDHQGISPEAQIQLHSRRDVSKSAVSLSPERVVMLRSIEAGIPMMRFNDWSTQSTTEICTAL
jgi:hypothetical protein